MSTEYIRIFDTTLRDGEQSPGCSMNLPEKLQLARQLERLGVDIIEAGFPIASDGDFESVQAIAKELRETTVCGLARTGSEDIERAASALEKARRPRIHTFIATSDIHLEHKLRMNREQVIAEVDRAVRQARGYCDDVEFSAEDATRSDLDYLVEVFTVAVEAGASTCNAPDTVGYSQPEEYAALIRHLREKVTRAENVVFSVHCHDDLGLAVSNSLAAVLAGAQLLGQLRLHDVIVHMDPHQVRPAGQLLEIARQILQDLVCLRVEQENLEGLVQVRHEPAGVFARAGGSLKGHVPFPVVGIA